MLEIKYTSSPHTANLVAKLLYDCISSWNLNGCVTAIITDNGFNMKIVFPILTQKDQCETIQRLPCIAHTLQLAIGKGLASELLDKLIDLLFPFERVTQYFSEDTYVMLSKMMLTIKEFTFDLATDSENLPSNDADYLNKDTIFEEDLLKTEGILEKVNNNVYNALLYYWDTPRLMATLLDLHYKKLSLELEDKKIKIIQKFHDEFNELNSNNSNNTTPITPIAELSNPIILFSGAKSSLRSQKEYR
ncbi:hypothetical protein C1646_749299 [Rhizophagus diaphanus]|nr:hypothetical protein C1646_749299 [Rhizophagus diaphanus] [Rhizophagus sp. MUCL 43196]